MRIRIAQVVCGASLGTIVLISAFAPPSSSVSSLPTGPGHSVTTVDGSQSDQRTAP